MPYNASNIIKNQERGSFMEAVHKIDDLGRILIPKALREPLGWNTGDDIVVKSDLENGTITLYHSSGDE